MVPVTAKARLHGGCFAFVVDGDKSEASISTTSTSSLEINPLIESVEGDERPPRITRDC